MTATMEGGEGIARAVELLAGGGIVALPTETVYGLAGQALDPGACAAIFEAKGRPLSDPLIVHLPAIDWLERLAVASPTALRLAAAFWPGPLTLVLPREAVVPDIVTAGQSTVALRMSAHPVFHAVAEALGRPLAAPSANRFGRVSPTCAGHVLEELGGRIPLILDGGPCLHGIESTIVWVDGSELRILRPGPIGRDALLPFGNVSSPAGSGMSVPGSLKSHYAPGTPLAIGTAPVDGQRCGLLAWQSLREGFEATEVLTPTGDPREAAARLYAGLRRLDALGLDLIVAEPPPDSELGHAISDRLLKAAAEALHE